MTVCGRQKPEPAFVAAPASQNKARPWQGDERSKREERIVSDSKMSPSGRHWRFHIPHSHLNSAFGDDWFGLKAEGFARFFGTPVFLIGQTIVVLIWIWDQSRRLDKFRRLSLHPAQSRVFPPGRLCGAADPAGADPPGRPRQGPERGRRGAPRGAPQDQRGAPGGNPQADQSADRNAKAEQ